MRPQRRSIGNVVGGRHHIGHQPLVAGRILARNHRSLRNRRVTHERRLDLAGLDAEAAQLHLLVGAPEKVEHPVGAPARQVPGPVHPAPRRPKRVRNKPLRRQPRPIQITARQPSPRYVKLPAHTNRHRLQARLQHVNPRVPDRTANRRIAAANQRFTHGRAHRRLGRAIGVDHPTAR